MAEKRYYWLKLHKDFFKQKEIKKLRRIAGGDVYTIIYLKMLLQSLETDGFLYFEGYYDNFVDELADDIDEDEENVKVVVAYLMDKGLMVEADEDAYLLIKCKEMTGSESSITRRTRRYKEKQKELTQRNEEAFLGNDTPFLLNMEGTKENTEIEKESEKKLDIDKESNKRASVNADFEYLWSLYPKKRGKQAALKAYEAAVKRGTTKEEVEKGIKAYIASINANRTESRYIKHGDTFFRGAHWQDEYDITGVNNNDGIYNQYGGISNSGTDWRSIDEPNII